MSAEEIAQARARGIARPGRCRGVSDADIQAMVAERARRFRDDAPTTAAAAATIILDGVKADRWRILVGEDAHRLDERRARSRRNAPTRWNSSKVRRRKRVGGLACRVRVGRNR